MMPSALLIGLLLSLTFGAPPAWAQREDLRTDIEALQSAAAEEGLVRVLVRLPVDFEPEAMLPSEAAVAAQRESVTTAQQNLLQAIPEPDVALAEPLPGPFVVLELTEQGLEALAQSGEVLAIQRDVPERAYLQDSVVVIGAPTAWAAGHTGVGQTVAILDTGVASGHPAFTGRVVREACFSSNSQVNQSETVCPNGQEAQIGAGAGVNCPSGVDGCDHGTHVAGIAAGDFGSFRGVAPDADIVAVQVFSRFTQTSTCAPLGLSTPCALTYPSDQIAALQHLAGLAGQLTLASVNMSLGGNKSAVACDIDLRKPPIDQLRSLGIATVIASGNDGFTDGIGFPACISSAVSVGSTTKSDNVSVFSNSAPILDLLAPGSSITAPVPGGSAGVKSGTSMATPHVTGAWAVLKQNPAASVTEVLNLLTTNGVSITDARNGLVRPRISIGLPGPAPSGAACSLCYTCGGAWPVFSGVIPTRSGASPWERGPECSGPLSANSDAGPYLCCRASP
jgi:subtilisin